MIRFLCGAADGDGDDESFLAAVAAAAAPPLQAAVDDINQGTKLH